MYSHKPPSLKPHNKAKNTIKNHFQKTALKPSSIKTTLTTIFHRLKRVICKMRSNNVHYVTTHISHLKPF